MKAIVYTSKNGHTAEYAEILGRQTGLPVYSLKDAEKQLANGTPIIYLGWLMASRIKGINKAKKKFKVSAVCGIGLLIRDHFLPRCEKSTHCPKIFRFHYAGRYG